MVQLKNIKKMSKITKYIIVFSMHIYYYYLKILNK